MSAQRKRLHGFPLIAGKYVPYFVVLLSIVIIGLCVDRIDVIAQRRRIFTVPPKWRCHDFAVETMRTYSKVALWASDYQQPGSLPGVPLSALIRQRWLIRFRSPGFRRQDLLSEVLRPDDTSGSCDPGIYLPA